MEAGLDNVVDSALRTDDHRVDETGERRSRHQTEKGLDYSKQQLLERRSRSWRAVCRKIDELSTLMKSSSNIDKVRTGQLEFEKLFSEFDPIHQEYKGILSEREEVAQNEVFRGQADKVIVGFKTDLIYWLRCHESVQYAMSTVSATSSKHSSASQQAMQQKAKLAALEEKRKFAAQEAELERQRLASEQKSKQLQIEKEMAVARAELSVYEEYEDQADHARGDSGHAPMEQQDNHPRSTAAFTSIVQTSQYRQLSDFRACQPASQPYRQSDGITTWAVSTPVHHPSAATSMPMMNPATTSSNRWVDTHNFSATVMQSQHSYAPVRSAGSGAVTHTATYSTTAM
jgi:hypothetical protein